MNSKGPKRRAVGGSPATSLAGEGSSHSSGERQVVCIGASAGGLSAIAELLRALPDDLDMAFVVVMHLDPSHASSLPELLDHASAMPVSQATQNAALEAGHVFVIPPNVSMTARAGVLRLSPRGTSHEPHRPIDSFMKSIAEEYDGRAIGVILSGTGSDGTAGLMAIKAGGGVTLAQDSTAEHEDMPRSAVAAGCVDASLPADGIARELVRIHRHPLRWLERRIAVEQASHPEENEDGDEETLRELIAALSRSTGIDFQNYKQTTLRRRIQRRVLLLRIERLQDYLIYFKEHLEEAEILCRDVLIHVTSFFRDPPVFDAIESVVLPSLLENRAPNDPLRIWVPGCATGEEVYSLAICLLEVLKDRAAAVPIKLFGTDVSESAIAVARTGWYPERLAGEVSIERLRRFFAKQEGGYIVAKEIRDLCVFAAQDATRDPPFSNLDLISCRNLLIYLGPILQQRVIPTFHYALREGGFLVLGTAESVGSMGDFFSPVGGSGSIYSRNPVPRRMTFELTGGSGTGIAGLPGVAGPGQSGGPLEAQREADRVVLARYAPAGVVIDDAYEILQFRGDTGPFLVAPPGTPSNNLLGMSREGLLPDLRSAVEESKGHDGVVRREGLRIRADGREVRASLEVTPIRVPGSSSRCFVILFEEVGEAAPPTRVARLPRRRPGEGSEVESERVARVERELAATRDYLRANVERLEVANEELRAANEEILSSNEELQSTNEELQTAKEELQATNEELLTVNEELQHRNREVSLLGDDLTNLLASAKIPIVMVGRDLQIRRFTPSAANVLRLLPADLGRSILELRLPVASEGLESDMLTVLEKLSIEERDVQDTEGRWYSRCIQPYRTGDNKIDGAVLTLIDIDAHIRLTDRLERARDYADQIVQGVRAPLLVVDHDGVVRSANRAFHETYETTPSRLESRRLGDDDGWTSPGLLAQLEELRRGGPPIESLELRGEAYERAELHMVLNAATIPDAMGGEEPLLLIGLEDVTERELRREEQERLTRKVEETQRLESLGILAGGIAHDFNNILTAILGFAEVIEAELPAGSPLVRHVEMIEDGARRAADLCDQMLAYSGRGRFQVEATDLSVLVRRSEPLLEAMVGRRTVIRFELTEGLPAVAADAAQMRQVLANLIINGSEALGDDGGEVTVATGVMHATADYLGSARHADLAAGDFVFLEVRDDGDGMESETQDRMFDPFFTTKLAGRGLGLAAVLGIVRGHRGALHVSSAAGRGSAFRLLLPPNEAQVASVPPEPSTGETTWMGTGTVLVIDDEIGVRSLLRRYIEALGLRFLEASDGRAGLDAFRADPSGIDVVLLDMTMPHLGGRETYQQLRDLRSDLPVILMSGFAEEESLERFPQPGLVGFLRKPFHRVELVSLLRSALGGDEPRADRTMD